MTKRQTAWRFFLPPEISDFEARYLLRLNRIALIFLALHVPLMMLLGWLNGTSTWLAGAITSAIVFGPVVASSSIKNPRVVSMTMGVAAMFMGGALVHFGQGPMQIEMHFYFFALLAMLAVFGNPLVIVAAAVTVVLHHLTLFLVLPRSVFNYEASVWVVAVHAAFVAVESVVSCLIARGFFDNVIGLEKIVHARTSELDRRNRDLRLVLDNVSQGLATIDRQGTLSDERSSALDKWLGPFVRGETLFAALRRGSLDFAERSELAWFEVLADVMPLELTLEQMPRHLAVGDQHYRLGYFPIGDAATPESFLVVVTDVTTDLRSERAERIAREQAMLFQRFFSERAVVQEFLAEAAALVREICASDGGDLPRLRRVIHTLKGNSAMFDLGTIASICEELESTLEDAAHILAPADTAPLEARWRAIEESVAELVGPAAKVIEVEEKDLAALEEEIRSNADPGKLLAMASRFRLEPTKKRLEQIAKQARKLGRRLDKDIEVQAQGNDLATDPGHWGGFWGAFIHAVRNAVDHGIEPGDVRLAKGKPPRGKVELKTRVADESFIVEISDDGGGIDWARITDRARALGLPPEADRYAALFHEGLSTASEVTTISGRGVGMSALREATELLGGSIEIDTISGAGTTLRMTFPKEAMSPAAHADQQTGTSSVSQLWSTS